MRRLCSLRPGFSLRAIALGATALISAGCSDDDPPGSGATGADGGTIQIRFEGRVGEAPFRCGESYPLGLGPAMYTPTDLRFYVSELEGLTADGAAVPLTLVADGTFQSATVALVDLEDGSGPCENGSTATHEAIVVQAPSTPLVGLRFTLGVPFDDNHQDAATAPSPLNVTSMFWNWQGGYKFLRTDGMVGPMGAADGAAGAASHGHAHGSAGQASHGDVHGDHRGSGVWNNHLGSTGCDGSLRGDVTSCALDNRVVVELPSFDPGSDVVVFDIARLLAASDLMKNTPDTAPGCMSTPTDPDCSGVFDALGLPHGDAPAGVQRVFSAATP